MARVRWLFPALIGSLSWAAQVGAQDATGTISGRVVEGPTQQPLAAVTVVIEGTQRGTLTRTDGTYQLTNVPAGTHRLRATRIGYQAAIQEVTLAAGGTATVDFAMDPAAVVLSQMVSIGYGEQEREAVTGSVATINAEAANVGVTTNVNEMIAGRAAGVTTVQNNGEPGAGVQIRIRGGTSISASNEPLYVIDGVPVNNVETETASIGIGGEPALPRNPMNLLNPADIASITILKDASATAIYGSRGANGVVLIETKKGALGAASVTYDGYVAAATAANDLDVLDGDEYRAFVQQQVDLGNLDEEQLDNLGTANTDWEDELTRRGLTHNHNLAFSGGGDLTRYRASLNYMNQQGIVLSNGFERYQGRLNTNHTALEGKMRLGLNMTASRVENDYLPFENTGGFEGGVFINTAIFNPTLPVTIADPATGTVRYYETGTGRQSVRNPVALAEQIQDFGATMRALGNATAELDLLPGLTGSINVGADVTDGIRQIYLPRSNPVGAEWGGRALQANRDNMSVTFQSLLTYRQQFLEAHSFDIVGGYEFADYSTSEFAAEGRSFISDATGYENLGGANQLVPPWSWKNEHRLVSFFTRANYSLADRYFLTGVLRRDGSSRFGAGTKWAVFPAISGAWRISQEPFMTDAPGALSDLRLRAGWGLQGNPAVPPYASLILLEAGGAGRYVFGETPVTGVRPVRNPNPNLKWEETAQWNVALDYGFLDQRFYGSLEYYVKNTTDLLLTVPVPQPALVGDRLENIGEISNRGIEFSLDANVLSRPELNWLAGIVFSAERNEVESLGGRSFISTGNVSGQGQTGQMSQRIMPGHSIGTFYGLEYAGVDGEGVQLFNDYEDGALVGTTSSPGADDFRVIGDANPDWSFGLRNQVDWKRFDMSFLIRGEMGREVFNNTALVYATQSNALQGKNVLASALDDETAIDAPAIYSSRWVEDGSFVRLQNVTVGYRFGAIPLVGGDIRDARIYVSGDNLLLFTDYSGLDPEVHIQAGTASRGIDYLAYPRARTFTTGISFGF